MVARIRDILHPRQPLRHHFHPKAMASHQRMEMSEMKNGSLVRNEKYFDCSIRTAEPGFIFVAPGNGVMT